MITALLLALLAAPADLVGAEAARLDAAAHRATAGAAVDLIRLEALAPWLPSGSVEARLRALGRDEKLPPLNRAVAWWLVRGLALDRLDAAAVREAVDALGLLRGFVVRPGAAPPPTVPLEEAGWRVYPAEVGAGELWLDSFVRPARDTQATVATRLTAAGGPAVLRIGFDDAVTVWLNGEEVYKAPADHVSWLDQAAIPVALRRGDNRLVVEVRQKQGAWRFLARLTDAAGRPLAGVSAHPDPWGACPEPAPPLPASDPPADLWRTLLKASDSEPPDAAGLRDLADYARRTGLPDADQAMPRVAIEGAWDSDPSPRTLRAWLDVLPEDQRAGVRAAHTPTRPIELADVYADLELRLDEAWTHYYARRPQAARAMLERLRADAPGFLPATHLMAILEQDLGLPDMAAALLTQAIHEHPRVPMLRRALAGALRSADRRTEQAAALKALLDDGLAGADEIYQLALIRRDAGDLDGAVALLDRVRAVRPELWLYGLEAAQMRLQAGDRADARVRLDALRALVPDEPLVLEPAARLATQAGDEAGAADLLRRAVAVDPSRDDLARTLDTLTGGTGSAPLGPPLEALSQVPSPQGPAAIVLYHHARTEIGRNGLATRRVRRVVRLLTEEGARRFGEWTLPYVPGSQRLEVERARLVRVGEPPASPVRTERDLSEPQWRLYYDLMAEVLTFPRPRPGDVIDVTWRLTDVVGDPAFPGYYGEVAYLQEAVPRATSIVEVVAAAPETLHATVVPNGVAVAREGSRFEAHDVPGRPLDRDSPGESSLRAYVHVSTADGWAEIGRRYEALLDGRDRPDEALAATAKRWAGDAATPEEALARLYGQVAGRIRYVGLELGLHSYKPERPAVTLARGYGDCKDKATLLIALARALGYDANLVLVRTRDQGVVAAEPASFAPFDHAIVYVPQLDRFLDPTVDRNDPWTLPPSDQDAVAFVVGVDQAPRRIPPQPADHNRNEWTFELKLGADGAARGSATWRTTGHPATLARRALEAEGTRRDYLERELAADFPGARVEEPRVSGIAPARDPVAARVDVALPPFPRSGSGIDVPLGGSPWRLVERFAHSAARDLPLELSYPVHEERTLRLRLPAGAATRVPAPVTLDGPFGRFAADATTSGGEVVLHAALEVQALHVPPARYAEFRAWLSSVDRALAATVEVKP